MNADIYQRLYDQLKTKMIPEKNLPSCQLNEGVEFVYVESCTYSPNYLEIGNKNFFVLKPYLTQFSGKQLEVKLLSFAEEHQGNTVAACVKSNQQDKGLELIVGCFFNIEEIIVGYRWGEKGNKQTAIYKLKVKDPLNIKDYREKMEKIGMPQDLLNLGEEVAQLILESVKKF